MSQRPWTAWVHGHGSLDPAQYASLAVTHVKYHPHDPLAVPLSLVTLAPPFLIVTYVAILLVRRELTIASAFLGQLACEGLNLVLKRTFKQGRPTDFLGTGYGMPSSHSQFAGYFLAFWCAHLLRFRPGMTRAAAARLRGKTGQATGGSSSKYRLRRSLIDVIRTLEHAVLFAFVIFGSLLTAYSRYHLSYHTPLQIFVGFSLGLACGGAWYALSEVILRRDDTLRTFGVTRSVRRIILEHPLFVALRIRDSWAVWDDGGIEAEYGLWRRQWDQVHAEQLADQACASISSTTAADLEQMLLALRLASQCDKTTTAFSVGCVITDAQSNRILATGYSREQPGNTHAEEVALNKLAERAAHVADDGKENVQVLSLYTTMEPCSERLSKKDACVERILAFNAAHRGRTAEEAGERQQGQQRRRMLIKRVVQGVREPDDFVQCTGTRTLHESGLDVISLSAHLTQLASSRSGSATLLTRGGDGGATTALTLAAGWLEREAIRLAKHGHDDQPAVRDNEERAWREEGWALQQTPTATSSLPVTSETDLRARRKKR